MIVLRRQCRAASLRRVYLSTANAAETFSNKKTSESENESTVENSDPRYRMIQPSMIKLNEELNEIKNLGSGTT